MDDFAAFACRLADAALAAIRSADPSPADKNEGGAFDPVTQADRDAEAAMRAMIERLYPEHGIAGEEFPERPGAGRFVWSLDPIDGTRAFVCGLPSWTILIALLDRGRPLVGLIDAPAMGERYLGDRDGARLVAAGRASALATSGCRDLAEARLSSTDPFLFAGAEETGFARLRAAVRLVRYGFDAYAYARLAAGTIDLVVESGLKSHDYNALVPVVLGAGGAVGNWRGGGDLSGGDIVAAATPALYDQAVACLGDRACQPQRPR